MLPEEADMVVDRFMIDITAVSNFKAILVHANECIERICAQDMRDQFGSALSVVELHFYAGLRS